MPSVSLSIIRNEKEMSTFPGLIAEIPGISVDRFDEGNINSSVYFLSHCHSDHMRGLGDDFFSSLTQSNKYLYCSPVTKAFLLGIYSRIPAERVIELELAVPRTIEYSVQTVGRVSLTVTTSAAGHCPGSVMFVFNVGAKTILYTGDFRIIPQDLPKLNPLNDETRCENWPKKFNVVYLDTTFLSLDFPSFPSRKESFEAICDEIEKWLREDPENVVMLECSGNYGAEYLFVEVAKILNTKIHVKEKVYSNYTRIAELSERVTNDGMKSRIHACTAKMTRKKLACRPYVAPKNILTVVPSAMRWRGRNTAKFTEYDPADSRRLYVCYSMHCSYDELRAFVDYFKPDKIVPCVYHDDAKSEIDQLTKILMNYNERSGEDKDNVRKTNLKAPVLKLLAKKSSQNGFKSKYFSDDDDDDC